MPITIEGTPFSTSAVKRMALPSDCVRTRPDRFPRPSPKGTPIKLAIPRMRAEPTMALAIPPPDFAYRLRHLGQKRPVDRSNAAIDEVAEDGDQRRQHEEYRQNRHASHDVIGNAAAQTDGRHRMARGGRRWPQTFPLAGWPRVTLHTRSCASAFTMMVTRNSARPISINDEGKYRQ